MQEGATGQNNHDDVGIAVQAVSVEMQSRQNDDGVRQDGHGAEYDSDETPSPSSSSPSPSSASGGGTASQRVLVPMVPQVLVQVVQQGSPGVNIAVNVQQNLLQGLIWVRAGAARSMWAAGVMTERVLVSVPIVPQFLEQALKQALKPYQPEALTSRGQRCCRSKMTV